MNCIVNYEIGTGRASDENGDDIRLEFCTVGTARDTVAGYVVIGGELHACHDFRLAENQLSFWVWPAPSWATLRNIVSVERSPVATYETVCDVFNRLARLEREGRHSGKTFYVAETVWGLLTSMGVVIDLWDVETELHYYGSMLDGSFNEWNVQAFVMWVERVAIRIGGEV